MKLNRLLLLSLFVTVFFVGCKDDEDTSPASSLENAQLSFSANETPIELPAAMIASDDPSAQLAVGYVQQINSITGQLAQFNVPSGATKSTTPIGRKNSDNGRTEEDYVVYTYTDGNFSVAYQISETVTNYVFELFWKLSPDSEYVKIIKAEESKLIKMGYLEYYTNSGQESAEEFIFRYEWNEDPNGVLYFDLLTPNNSFRINAVVNPDNSGTIDYYSDSVLFYELSWNADGSGSWVRYDGEGSLSDSGDWTV